MVVSKDRLAAMVGQRRKAVHPADDVDQSEKVELGRCETAYTQEDVFDPFTNKLHLTKWDIVKVCASMFIARGGLH